MAGAAEGLGAARTLLDQADDAWVTDPVLDEANQGPVPRFLGFTPAKAAVKIGQSAIAHSAADAMAARHPAFRATFPSNA